MTINEIVNSLDLMFRTTKDRVEQLLVNHDVSSSQSVPNQLPSIVISSSASGCHQNAVKVAGDIVVHQPPGPSAVPKCTKSNHSALPTLNSHMPANSAGTHFAKMNPPSGQLQTKVQVQADGLGTAHKMAQVPVCIDVRCLDDSPSETQAPDEAEGRSAISRPTTLNPKRVSLSTPKPPEFSISPAESLSKASSNEQMSSTVFHLPTAYKAPHSPSSLSVNFCYNNTNMVLSSSFTSLQGSLASSINDLTVEAEQLERAIRHNDVKFVSRMLELYKSQSEKLSQSSRRSSNQDGKVDRPVLKTQIAFDEQNNGEVVRRESGSTEERECSSVFTNALHLAIENNAYDVTILLLKSGIDPNEAGVAPYTIDFWRRSSHTSEESNVQSNHDRLHASNLNLAGGLSASREPLIRTPSIRTTNTPMLLSPQTGPSFLGGSHQPHLSLYFSANSSPSSINSDLSSMCLHSSPTRLVRLRPEMAQSERTVYKRADGSSVSYEDEYTRDRLFTLPPIFLAVALNNSAIVRELIQFGANVNAADSHGVTPLHLCLCQEHISRACLCLLVQSGAKMRVKNKQSIAPFELVDRELTEEVLYLQKFIIDDSFGQLLPSRTKQKLNTKDTMMYANYKSLEKHLLDANSNSSVNLATITAKNMVSKEESVDSCSSGPNLARFFEPKGVGTPSGEVPNQRKKGQVEPSRQGKNASKDVHICMNDFSDTVHADSGSTSQATNATSSLFLPNTISNLMGHKRSFACESTVSANMKTANSNLSQSTLHLSTSKENQGINRSAAQHASSAAQQLSSVVGARIFGRRRSGDENMKTQAAKHASRVATLSRTNTQDESRADESATQRLEANLEVLCQMSCNVECIHLIISSLQKHLPEIISLNESQNTLWRLHSGLSRLFNRSLQAIVGNFVLCRDRIAVDAGADQNAECRPDTAKSMLCLKQEMSTQLCGLLVCALQCLKGGQTFQYSSLLIVNLIIDSFIRFECCTIPLNLSKVFDFDSDHGKSDPTENTKPVPAEKSEKHSSAISAAANIGKHFRNLRINESFNFKQNLTNKEDKVKQIQLENKSKPSEQTTPKKTSDQNRLISWMKQVHISPKLNQRRQLNMINELILNSSGKGLSDDATKLNSNLSPRNGKDAQLDTKDSSLGEMKTPISILINEGLDLILNVLNNAITLHRRVSGSKHSCTPSKRSRQCIYHCLQILSARAILFGSQCEESQKRLIKEGPLKVLIASIDSTHDPQLICLALQVIANLSINPTNHTRLIEADITDCLMQLILPSDEWFYTNHSTKYAKFVKHQAARIMVYLGLEKRLRNKVYLFDLMENLGVQSPQSESAEDSYITQTSVAPSAVYSQTCPTLLIGSSVEAIILDLIKQVEDKIINGEDSLCIDPLNDETYFMENADTRTIKEPPAIQVDLPSGIIGDRRITNQHPNCFFYLSTLPMALQPIMILRVLQHRMFGVLNYWAWHSNAVSRASVASAGGSSIEFNRSRASSNASNANFEISTAFNLKRNVNLHCSNTSLSPGRFEVDRRPSVKGFFDNRLTLQNSLPLTTGNMPKGVHLSNSLSTIGQNSTSPYGNKLPVQMPMQRYSLIEQQLHHHVSSIDSPTDSPTANKRFRFSSLRRNRHSLSTENTSPTASARNHSLDANERNEAYIKTFQRELQNLPKTESPSPMYSSQAVLTNSLASIIREAFERTGTPLKRPRSCSVPRITLENVSSTLLQLPGNAIDKSQVTACSINPLIRSATSDISCSNAPALNSGPSPSLSPIKVAARNLNESPISYNSTVRSTSRSGSRSGSAGQVMTESIMPNVHKAILRLLLDWVSLCPNDFQHSTSRRELVDFLNRVACMGDNYRWMVEEIRIQADIDDKENLVEQPSGDSLINKEYKSLQKLILSGELPCSKEEAATLAVIQLRIEETSPQSKENETRHIGSILPSASLRQSSIIEEKLRPICEDVKEASPIETDTPLHLAPVNMSSSFDELEEDEQDELEAKEKFVVSGAHCSTRLPLGQSVDAASAVAFSGPSGDSFLPTLTKKTTSRLCHWMSSNWASRGTNFSSIDVRECLPPVYHNTKNIVKTIKEQKRKLFHSPMYESEQQLKKLYIQTCKRLPAFGCRIFQVKELLHGKTNRRATRLLGICLERIVLLDSKTLQPAKVQSTTNLQQWRTGGGRSHDRLVLEFRGTKWSFVTPSHGSLRAIGTVLWEIMQDLDACFLDTLIAGERQDHYLQDGNKMKVTSIDYYGFSKTMYFRDELQCLESLLHFPEEVALRLTQIEHELFYNIEPVHYIRQVTVELNSPGDRSRGDCSDRAGLDIGKMDKSFTVKELIERFSEVSSWITHIIISQPTHEMRKAILSCIMRVVQTCWNLGNFNSAVEILAGLKSEKLKPFWLSIEQKDEPFLRKKLSDILLTLEEPSEEYKSAVIRALDIPHSKTIPFFGAFLRDLKTILQRVPSLIVLASEQNWAQTSTDSRPHFSQTTRIDSISEFNGEDNYMSRIGVGGIINIEKMYKTHQVLDNIRTFHIHAIRRNQLLSDMKCSAASNIVCVVGTDGTQPARYYQIYCENLESELAKFERLSSNGLAEEASHPLPSRPSTQSSANWKQEKEQLYQIDFNSYRPIQALPKSHGISVIPLDVHSIDYHNLQAMHHGMTTIHFEEDTGRSSVVFLQLEESNSTLAWCKPYWSTSLRSSGNTPQDYQLSLDIEETILTGVTMKYETKEAAMIGLEEGFIDLMYLKDIVVGQCNADLTLIARRHCLPDCLLAESNNCVIKLLFGVNLSDNRTTEFIAPKNIGLLWVEGLRSVLYLIHKQKKLCDQRMLWLKEKYLQLYYEDAACTGPTPAEAIRVFGGRKWTIDAMGASHQSLQIDPLSSKVSNNSSKLRKKKSTVSLSVIRDYSTRSQLSISSEPEAVLNNVRNSQQSPQHSYKSPKVLPKVRGAAEQPAESAYDSQSSLSAKSTSSSEMPKSIAVFDNSPIHTSLLTSAYREKFCKRNPPTLFESARSASQSSKEQVTSPHKLTGSQPNTPKHKIAITHSSNMNFIEFSELFRSFLICIRRDIKDIFEQIASKSDIHTFLEAESSYLEEKQAKQEKRSNNAKHEEKESKFLGLLTRNTIVEHCEEDYHKSRIFDAIARASIVTNSAGINTLKTAVLTATDFYAFINTYQCEDITLDEVKRLIDLHEPNPILRKRGCLSFEGFARYLMDKNNFAYTPELNQTAEEDMDFPLSHYYIASSHNTYLTGHQLKGESSVELYSQVLLTGCRCVELDCWDGDDGMPLIYHGHTLTSKIPFKKVVETINEKAFVASPYPVILSVENHCSLQQQAKMAQIFLSVFGDKLVTKFLFESDYSDEPVLPSPNQLKYRILIKNKKLRAPLHPSLNLKTRTNIAISKATNGRTNSLVSNVSTGSLNDDDDDEYDDEDEDEEVDESLQPSTGMGLDSVSDKKTDDGDPLSSGKSKTSSQVSKLKSHSQSDHHSSQDTDSHLTNSPYVHSKVVRKSSSQIAPELSDLVIYCQAIKFRGLLSTAFNLSPTSSNITTPISKKMSSRKALTNATFNSTIQASASLLPVIESNKIRDELRELSTPSPTFSPSASNASASMNKRPNSSAACYQISSINENTAKKLCRKTPLAVIAHTESQIMRTYPAGMRIDSSNFNPVIFWAFGIQSVALNYQTVDTALHINSAMFEQNGSCGYVLKTNVMRDKSHLMFGRFNPWEKEFDGLHTITLTITIISGQYVCPNTNTGSPQVEVEIIGIPVDCNRQRTKIVQRNSLNPIWNDNFFFRIKFVDLAFIRVTVSDMGTSHLAAQRIIPVKCLKQGYRHVRLHGPQNQSLPLSTLFIYSSYEEEGLDIESETSSEKAKAKSKMMSKLDLNRLEVNKPDVAGTAPVKRRMFFLMVHAVMPEEPSTILKITQDSTVTDVIMQALTKANKAQENVNDYVLLEEVSRGWEKKRISDRNTVTQRLLDPSERPLEAQSNWKGEGRFILKKMADDPSTRAWMTSIRSSSANKERAKRQDHGCARNDEIVADWEEEQEKETFLVCIYNVSQDQPYTILKASVSSSSQDIITQALLKAHRVEDPKSFVIVEEVENFSETNQGDSASFSFKSKPGMGYRRVVGDHENIYDVQTQWKNKGKFELKYRKEVTVNDNTFIKNNSPSSSKLLRGRGSLKKLSQLHRSYSKRLQRKDCVDSPSTTRKNAVPKTQGSPPAESPAEIDKKAESDEARQAHSEGEMPSDSEEQKTKDSVGSLTRLKKLSLKRLKVWKS